MQSIKPSSLQTINDLAIQLYGSIVYGADIAHANGLDVTDDITGLTIVLPDIEITAIELKIVNDLAKVKKIITTKYPL